MLFWQFTAIVADSQQFCNTTVVPTLGISCPGGALSLIEFSNWFFLFLYLYFTAVAYESWDVGSKLPHLIKREALRQERRRVQKENDKKEKALQTEMHKKQESLKEPLIPESEVKKAGTDPEKMHLLAEEEKSTKP